MKYLVPLATAVISLLLAGACGDLKKTTVPDGDSLGTDTSGQNGADDGTPPADIDTVLTCGNGTIENGETCDGGMIECTTLNSALYKAGKATCRPDCSGWDTVTCEEFPYTCGNDVVETGEACEKGDMTDCVDIDPDIYIAGKAYCKDDCSGWDTATCDISPDADIAEEADIVADGDTPDTDTPTTDDEQPDADTGDCNTMNVGKNCKTDTECGTCLICVNAKCAEGCLSDADCTAYAGTTCNRKLSRCLNTIATFGTGICNETNCPTGCCYATKGFQSVKCLATATLATCGICKQGEIYMDGKQCVPAACKVGETKCQTFNATDPRSECFECKTGDLICYDNPSCQTGAALLIPNVALCIPAGEQCSEGATCCSGTPCIKGYCY